MKVGFAAADITPTVGLTLSGFIARQNKPCDSIHDRLRVCCLALGEGGGTHFLFAFDLLGIGSELLQQLHLALAAALGETFSPTQAAFCSTHTHSAPATIVLEGCGIIDPDYWQHVVQATVSAAREAIAKLKEAKLRVVQRRISGLTHNRRRILEDGRVSMAIQPAKKIIRVGPVDDTLTILAWHDSNGKCLAAIVHFSAHPVCNGSLTVTADFPGVLCPRIESALGSPCLFLQGASGDINPIPVAQTVKEAVEYGQQLGQQVKGFADELRPVAITSVRSASTMFPLQYERAIDTVKLKREMEQFEIVASWRPGAPGADEAVRVMADIMNIDPKDVPDPEKHAFNARTLAMTMRRTLKAIEQKLPPCPLFLAAWDIGDVCFHFAGAELFAWTGLELKKLAPGKIVLPVGYCAPLVGYLPTRDAMKEGGYEADYAWRYYGHPATFKSDSEERVRQRFKELVEKTSR